MKLVTIAAGLLAASLTAGARADTVLSEGFDSVASLTASGWVFTNASSPAGLSWFQGNEGVFPAQSGAAGSYAAANFNSTTSTTGVVDNWLISPELTIGAGSTLTFYTQASDAGFLDLLEVRFSSGASSAVASFSTLLGTVGSTAYPVGTWTAYSVVLPTATTGRFAFHYAVANALDASYIGIDTVTVATAAVTAVPEPGTYALMAFGLGALGLAHRRRARAAASTPL